MPKTVQSLSTAFNFSYSILKGDPRTVIMPQPEREINFDNPVLQIEGLQTRFNTIPLSGCLARLLGSNDLALIVQQLHYWLQQGYGVVIDGIRWIHKSIKSMREEVFPTLSHWQLSKLISQLVEREILKREKLFTKHQIQQGDRFWWQPKNQTYYYTLNREKLQELANNYQGAETPETSVFCSTKILSIEVDQNTKFSDCPKNNTDITSIENNSKDKSHPTLPCRGVVKKPLNQREDLNRVQIETVLARPVKNYVDSTESEVIEKKISSAAKKEIVKENNLDKIVTKEKPKPKVEKTKPGTKPKRKNLAPWKDEGEFKRFYRQLITSLPRVANARSPEGLAQTIIRQLRSGIPHSYWDDFKAGLPIGSSLQKEWEVQPGVPYPMFLEYLAEKLKGGYDAIEKAYQGALKILEQPQQAQVFWSQFKRSLINVSEQVEKDRALGVSNPHTPIWTRERVEPSTEEAATAGATIMGVNNAAQAAIEASSNPQLAAARNTQLEASPQSNSSEVTTPDPWSDESHTDDDDSPKMSLREMFTLRLGKRNPKGFVKKMPQVSQEEVEAEAAKEELASRNGKVKINRMTIAEINESLQDPILRKVLTPQLWHSDYALITDELGEIIGVERSSSEE